VYAGFCRAIASREQKRGERVTGIRLRWLAAAILFVVGAALVSDVSPRGEDGSADAPSVSAPSMPFVPRIDPDALRPASPDIPRVRSSLLLYCPNLDRAAPLEAEPTPPIEAQALPRACR
jgi:hypothetical protein